MRPATPRAPRAAALAALACPLLLGACGSLLTEGTADVAGIAGAGIARSLTRGGQPFAGSATRRPDWSTKRTALLARMTTPPVAVEQGVSAKQS